MIKTIIFDYAGVISPTRDNYLFATKYADRFGVSPLALMEKTYKNWDEASLNHISSHQFWNDAGKELNISGDELEEMLIQTFPVDVRMVELIKGLKGKYTIVMMSNQIDDWLEGEIDKYSLRDKFDYFLNSYQVGLKKPDSRIFELAVQKTGSSFEECLFIDDASKNVEQAKKLEMHTIQFDTYEQFMGEFNSITDSQY
ncbi:MAG: HAD-IA family hydrolase [bacterium]|nr:HAD-IA family hydrolase [bacterium]